MKKCFERGLIVALLFAFSAAKAEPAIYGYEVIAEFPHDPKAFTQGLYVEDGYLYEGTGQYRQSSLRKVEIETGRVLQQRALPAEVFGEGVAPWKNTIIGLTWRNAKGFVFDEKSFETQREFAYQGEGWGLTSDGKRLIMSDGTSTLRFLDPETLAETGRVTVTHKGKPLARLNELEWVDGEVFANIWLTDIIARIDPNSGEVTGLIDMRGLKERLGGAENIDVLNGVAYDPKSKRLFVTGKYWPKLFEIRLVKR